MCSATWENLSSRSFCPPVYPVNVCQLAAVPPARGPEDTRSSSSSARNMLQSFGLLWLVTTVIASHSCCHIFPSDSLSAIGKCSISLLLVLSLCLNWSSKLHPGMRREAWSIGHTGERLSLFLCCLLDTGRLTQNRQIPFAGAERFFLLVAYLSWSVLSCASVPVSTFSSLLCFPHISFPGLFLSDKPRLNEAYKHYPEAVLC